MIFSCFNKLSDYVKEEKTAEIVASLQLGAAETFCRAGDWFLVITEGWADGQIDIKEVDVTAHKLPQLGGPRPRSSGHLPSRSGYLFLENSLFVNKL